ncbi:putative dienelactone hydrolase [Actinoplanes tereljensis]|uniref:alpha/beta hydrolase family protein n=1 Tax=Paractinoplanes tereljensis TaxID=571912 RepID=UPI0019436415|nr:dienelactone hydrolase family protein [Actinoplanes tereljensis]
MRRLGAFVVLVALLAGCGGSVAHAESRAGVTTRILLLARGRDRPLPTTIWSLDGLTGKHPVVLFSHGLGGLPAHFAPLAATWARAGFIVVAPTYPHTNAKVRVDRSDVRNQPADAAFALHAAEKADPRLDAARVVAVGFSAGGTTTLGLLRAGHDPGIVAAVSVAGRRPPSAFGGPSVPVLFVHGDRDGTVPLRAGRDAYAALPWPKTFVTVPAGRHGDYLKVGRPGYPMVSARILAFLQQQV